MPWGVGYGLVKQQATILMIRGNQVFFLLYDNNWIKLDKEQNEHFFINTTSKWNLLLTFWTNTTAQLLDKCVVLKKTLLFVYFTLFIQNLNIIEYKLFFIDQIAHWSKKLLVAEAQVLVQFSLRHIDVFWVYSHILRGITELIHSCRRLRGFKINRPSRPQKRRYLQYFNHFDCERSVKVMCKIEVSWFFRWKCVNLQGNFQNHPEPAIIYILNQP